MGVEPTPRFLDEASGFAAREAPGAIAPETGQAFYSNCNRYNLYVKSITSMINPHSISLTYI
ncbi:MAG TPA: hypothetical protein ENN18_02095 [Proteobacteria bacterium]|nr:hypothetical protein [Pseudomonadota bacterium]